MKSGKIPVKHDVIWEFGPGAGLTAIWEGEWRKRWLMGYEWKITIIDSLVKEPYTTWKPVDQLIFDTGVIKDCVKYNVKIK